MRLIDADKLECVSTTMPKDASEDYKEGYGDGMNYVLDIIDNLPTINPVKYGQWVNDKGLYRCTACNELWCDWWASCVSIERMNKNMPYCPKCGAKMKRDWMKTNEENKENEEMSKVSEMEMAYGEYLND